MGVTAVSSDQTERMFFESTAGGAVASELGKASLALVPARDRTQAVGVLVRAALSERHIAGAIDQGACSISRCPLSAS